MKKNGKIKLTKNGGPIVFIGSTNAMPMMYAIELKKMGYDVLYFVDRPQKDALNRPENHFSDIDYPYPDWIVEISLRSQMLIPYFRLFFSMYLNFKIKSLRNLDPQLYVLNSLFISLAPYLVKKSAYSISLTHGGDLDSWADIEGAKELSESFSSHSFFKYLPKFLSRKLIVLAVHRQFYALTKTNLVVYFPYGFNAYGDRVIDALKRNGVPTYGRYDISFEPLKNQNREYKERSSKFVVFSGVRFTYKTFSEGNNGYSKGNDVIIKGLAKFFKKYSDLEVHFVEKGLDFNYAKKLCEDTGLAPAVVWHKEMSLIKLFSLYLNADVCFDQVGCHWIGAIGGYALYLGKPLIANVDAPVNAGLWPEDNPIFSASNEDEVFQRLEELRVDSVRKAAHRSSKKFVEKHMSPHKALKDIFDIDIGVRESLNKPSKSAIIRPSSTA